MPGRLRSGGACTRRGPPAPPPTPSVQPGNSPSSSCSLCPHQIALTHDNPDCHHDVGGHGGKETLVKSHTVYKTFETARRREMVRITEAVQRAVDEAGI